MMLETALLSAVIALTVTTVMLLGAGRRQWSGVLVRLAAPVVLIVLLTVLGAPPEAIVVGVAIAVIGLFLPRTWYGAGAWFFASLSSRSSSTPCSSCEPPSFSGMHQSRSGSG